MPDGIEASGLRVIEPGRYELPRRSGDAHLYRVNHPLALWITQQAKARTLDGARLVFDCDGYGTKAGTLEPYRGKTGRLTLKRIEVSNQEQHLLVADDPEKFLRLPATTQAASLFNSMGDAALSSDVEDRKTGLLREINQRNLGSLRAGSTKTGCVGGRPEAGS